MKTTCLTPWKNHAVVWLAPNALLPTPACQTQNAKVDDADAPQDSDLISGVFVMKT